MNGTIIFGILAICLALASFVVLIFFVLGQRGKLTGNYRSLMGNAANHTKGGLSQWSKGEGHQGDLRGGVGHHGGPSEIRIKDEGKLNKRSGPTVEELMFQAGVFSEQQQQEFARLRLFSAVVGACIALGSIVFSGGELMFILTGVCLGGYLGLKLPFIILNKKIKQRSEETLFYLPLVIEQLAIGVSSSLDIGPCMQRVVQMADERDTHNVVTELLNYVQQYIRTGVSMEDSLEEVGRRSGQTELKHAFLALAQVAKHGGEISRQLQELADSVSAQREARIDAMIKKLELKATGPVVLVFAAFLFTLLGALGLILKNAF